MNVVPVALSDEKLLRSAERVHRQLRPHIKDYVVRIRQVLAAGAEMAVCVVEGEVAGITVFRVLEKTHSGRDLYCDDLVTDEAKRSTGVGHALIEYMEGICRERSCDTFSLDSGCQRQQAHKFYFREGMVVTSFHFDKKISKSPTGTKFS
jgi:GNAT superfamily N-acetyltransferase